MNRRNFIISTSAISLVSVAMAGEKSELPKSSTYRIVMVDPRLITKTKDTYAVGWEKKRSDVMGSVYLSHDESVRLKELLTGALTPSDNVPFCGHAPGYVIVQMDDGRPVSFVSVCALCKTWCNAKGDLRVLDDSQLMPFLTKVLPLPSAFSKVQKLPDLFDLHADKSYLELPSRP
jgi:hypothetical protein